MKTKVKTVYYCGFCKKHSLRPLTDHEKHCTGNINRVCRLCSEQHDLPVIVKNLSGDALYDTTTLHIKGADVLSLVDGCPACALTIAKAMKRKFEFFWLEDFDYKEELKAWWDCVNEENYQEQLDSEIYY